MTRAKYRTSRGNVSFRLHAILLALAAAICLSAMAYVSSSRAQTLPEGTFFHIGERLTYNVTIGRFTNAAFAELYCVSRGRLGDKDAVELRAKFKTLDLASATFYLIDEDRTTFVSPTTGLPLYTSISQNTFGLPKQTVQSYLAAPAPHADLLSMIYRLRQSGAAGTLTMQDGEKVYTFTFQSGVSEKQKTDAGEFDTTLVTLQSEYFTERGMTNVRVNLSNDEARLPVVVRFRTPKGNVRAGLANVQTIEPEVVAASPTPAPARTPLPERTPKPLATPAPYIENQPLASELAFDLGERLDYKILSGGQQVATMRLSAKERKQINNFDTLVLEASFSDVRSGSPFAGGDYIRAYVNPETLAPRQFEMRFNGALRGFSNNIRFEQEGSAIVVGAKRVEAPVGTHSILSLLYAARSFNLKPSRNLNNPINDTRVAVFWESQPYIFTLRPSPAEVITLDGKPVAAQLVSVSTKNTLLDQMSIKIWLGNDEARIPLRFMVGGYQADFVGASRIQPN